MQQISLAYLAKFSQNDTVSFAPVDLLVPTNIKASQIADEIRMVMTNGFGVGFHTLEVYMVKCVVAV